MSDTAVMTAIAMVLGAVAFGLFSNKYGAESRYEFDERSNLS